MGTAEPVAIAQFAWDSPGWCLLPRVTIHKVAVCYDVITLAKPESFKLLDGHKD